MNEVLKAFNTLDIRIGTIIDVKDFPEARKPAWQLWVDFGPEIGVKKSSAQVKELYALGELRNRQVLGLVNVPPRQIGPLMSECLVLGAYTDEGVVLLATERPCNNGDKIG